MFIWCDSAQWFKAWKAEFPSQAWQVQPRLDPVGGDSALGLVPWPGSGLQALWADVAIAKPVLERKHSSWVPQVWGSASIFLFGDSQP